MIQRIILGKCDFQSFMELGKLKGIHWQTIPELARIPASACLLGLASAQFEDICAGANGNTECCYSNGADSTYLFMGASDVESNLLLCLANGGHLAYIESQAENDCLNQYIQEGKHDFKPLSSSERVSI